MGKRGLKRVQTFRWEKVAEQVTDIYKDALDRRAGSASSVAAVGHREKARESLSRYLETPAARLLVRLKIPPNAITVAGLLVTALAAYLVSQDNLLIGGLVFLFASIMDMLDGGGGAAQG